MDLDQFLDDSVIIEGDIYISDTEVSIVTEGANLDTARLIRADDVKKARTLVKEGKKLLKKHKPVEDYKLAAKKFAEARTLIEKMKRVVDNSPEPVGFKEKLLSYFTPIFTLMPAEEIKNFMIIPDGNGGYYYRIETMKYTDHMSSSTNSKVKEGIQYRFNLFLHNLDKYERITQELTTRNKNKVAKESSMDLGQFIAMEHIDSVAPMANIPADDTIMNKESSADEPTDPTGVSTDEPTDPTNESADDDKLEDAILGGMDEKDVDAVKEGQLLFENIGNKKIPSNIKESVAKLSNSALIKKFVEAYPKVTGKEFDTNDNQEKLFNDLDEEDKKVSKLITVNGVKVIVDSSNNSLTFQLKNKKSGSIRTVESMRIIVGKYLASKLSAKESFTLNEDPEVTEALESVFVAAVEGTLTAAQRRAIPDNLFAIPETRSYPLNDESHVRSAISYFRYVPTDKRQSVANAIVKRMKALHMTMQFGSKLVISKYVPKQYVVENDEREIQPKKKK